MIRIVNLSSYICYCMEAFASDCVVHKLFTELSVIAIATCACILIYVYITGACSYAFKNCPDITVLHSLTSSLIMKSTQAWFDR